MYRVINKFKDKYTGAILRPGDSFASDDSFRVEDLVTRKLIEDATTKDEEFTEDEETNKNDGEFDSIAFTKMKKEDLVKYAKEVMEIELSMEMTKDEMIELLEK